MIGLNVKKKNVARIEKEVEGEETVAVIHLQPREELLSL